MQLADDAKLGGTVDLLEVRKALERDLHRLEPRAKAEGVRYNQAKCQVLPLGHDNPLQLQAGQRGWETAGRTLAVLVTEAGHEPRCAQGKGTWAGTAPEGV